MLLVVNVPERLSVAAGCYTHNDLGVPFADLGVLVTLGALQGRITSLGSTCQYKYNAQMEIFTNVTYASRSHNGYY
jgi:hypothetical protein